MDLSNKKIEKKKKLPSQRACIRGIFYKKDPEIQNESNKIYHFLFPGIYSKNNNCHTANTLQFFEQKVNKFFEDELDNIAAATESSTVSFHKPVYRDPAYRDYKSATHFKCKSTDSMSLIVGREYLINCDLYAYNFIGKNSENLSSNISGWLIKIICIKEVEA